LSETTTTAGRFTTHGGTYQRDDYRPVEPAAGRRDPGNPIRSRCGSSRPDGVVRRVTGIFTDTTERRNAAATARSAQLDGEQANAAKDEFLSRRSHEPHRGTSLAAETPALSLDALLERLTTQPQHDAEVERDYPRPRTAASALTSRVLPVPAPAKLQPVLHDIA
jgi:hypothetical protein